MTHPPAGPASPTPGPGPGRRLITLPAELAALEHRPVRPGHVAWPGVTPPARGTRPLQVMGADLVRLWRVDRTARPQIAQLLSDAP